MIFFKNTDCKQRLCSTECFETKVTMITLRVPIETLWSYSSYCHDNYWCITISAGHDVGKKTLSLVPYHL